MAPAAIPAPSKHEKRGAPGAKARPAAESPPPKKSATTVSRPSREDPGGYAEAPAQRTPKPPPKLAPKAPTKSRGSAASTRGKGKANSPVAASLAADAERGTHLSAKGAKAALTAADEAGAEHRRRRKSAVLITASASFVVVLLSGLCLTLGIAIGQRFPERYLRGGDGGGGGGGGGGSCGEAEGEAERLSPERRGADAEDEAAGEVELGRPSNVAAAAWRQLTGS
jgi:hypothetical protein